MDYEQDARDKQTYASFGGRKPQLLGDDRDALIASQARRIEELEKGLEQLEAANQRLASTRSSETYHMMLTDNGAEDALEALDDARSRARSLLNRTGEG